MLEAHDGFCVARVPTAGNIGMQARAVPHWNVGQAMAWALSVAS